MHMIVAIQHLPIEGVTLAFRRRAESFPVLRSLAETGECRFPDPVDIELTVVPERNLIRADGSISTTLVLACSRCLTEFKSDLRRTFILRFARQTEEDRSAEGQPEIELKSEHIGLSFFTGESIDFSDSVQEQIVLALPYKPLCKEDCKGLCQRCGADLNAGPCNCAEDRSHHPFAVLKGLSLPAPRREKK